MPRHSSAPRTTLSRVARPKSTPDDPRLGQLFLRKAQPTTPPRVVLIGFPSDRGVTRNGGRAGAAAAPDAVRAALYSLTPGDEPMQRLAEQTLDAGNLAISRDLERDQERLGVLVASWIAQGTLPILIGGGHETSFGHFLGYAAGPADVSILNWDAHTDVRALVAGKGHSGSMFRQAILHGSGRCREYIAAGLLPHSVAAQHVAFIRDHGGRIVWKDELTSSRVDAIYAGLKTPAFVSFDLDALDASVAPGVSAPAAGGMSSDLWLHAARAAGRSRHVTSMDLAEMNPRFDRDGCTARIAALTIWQFLLGLSERPRARRGNA